jgi:hypothetical protein
VTTITPRAELQVVTLDLYRDVHKGIRSELFAVTETAGRLDVAQLDDRTALASHVRSVVEMLIEHAEHEDSRIQPVLEENLPALAEQIASDHETLETRLHDLAARADAAVDVHVDSQRREIHHLYLELASFTAAYLEHQDHEERVVMPALERAIGVEAVVGIHEAIIANIPPDRMARFLAVMLPAMNIDDRTELLGGMQAGAPVEVFDAVWSLAGSVLTAADRSVIATRLSVG